MDKKKKRGVLFYIIATYAYSKIAIIAKVDK